MKNEDLMRRQKGADYHSSSENDDDLEDEVQGKSLFSNPLLAGNKNEKEGSVDEDREDVEAEESWSDDDAEEKKANTDKNSKLKMLGKRKAG